MCSGTNIGKRSSFLADDEVEELSSLSSVSLRLESFAVFLLGASCRQEVSYKRASWREMLLVLEPAVGDLPSLLKAGQRTRFLFLKVGGSSTLSS